jgi:hypothetical protein
MGCYVGHCLIILCAVVKARGRIYWEWPNSCQGWKLEEIKGFRGKCSYDDSFLRPTWVCMWPTTSSQQQVFTQRLKGHDSERTIPPVCANMP